MRLNFVVSLESWTNAHVFTIPLRRVHVGDRIYFLSNGDVQAIAIEHYTLYYLYRECDHLDAFVGGPVQSDASARLGHDR